jgi:hypothetical protein
LLDSGCWDGIILVLVLVFFIAEAQKLEAGSWGREAFGEKDM